MSDYRKSSKKNTNKPIDNLDLEALARLVAQEVSKNINTTTINPSKKEIQEELKFDPTSSLKQLADNMVVQRGNKQSNFSDLGGVKETKKDKNTTDQTIDILKDLED